MNGGLFKTTSRTALAAVAASFAATSAMAADLGGNCCADLEERIAELEATTVRKGNRKVSLTLSGHVHQSILFWDDGHESNTYVGVNNINSSTRFRLVGSAKIDAEWSAGYLIEVEPLGVSNTSSVNQLDDDAGSSRDVLTRHSAWWIDNKRMGRIWLGYTDTATAGLEGINLANTAFAANNKWGLQSGGFLLRNTAGALSGVTWGVVGGRNSGYTGLGNETRLNTVKYVSPTIAGFIFSAAYAEDDFWDVSLKYANEFNGVRVAFGVGYAQTTDANPNTGASTGTNFGGCVDAFGVAGADSDRDCSSFTIASSMMHVPTGLFVSGHYGYRDDDNRRLIDVRATDRDESMSITAGLERNFTGLGKTTLFGQWMSWEGAIVNGGTIGTTDVALVTGAGRAINSEVDVWSLGMVQGIDAAAMDLYLVYRNHSADLETFGGTSRELEDFSVISMGGVIKF